MHHTLKWLFVSWLFFLISPSESSPINNEKITTALEPPERKHSAEMARFVVHQADWVSLATVTNIGKVKGYPFSSIASMVDGTVEKSRATPYFYLTHLDYTAIDLAEDERTTMSATLASTDYCRQKNYDAMDPRCARVMLTGRIVKVQNDTEEFAFAKNALIARHPSFQYLPPSHGFFVAKLVIEHIAMLDWFGGPAIIQVDEYLSYTDNETYFPEF